MTITEITTALESIGFEQWPSNWCDAFYVDGQTCIEIVGMPTGDGRMFGYIYPGDDGQVTTYRHLIPKDAADAITTAELWSRLDLKEATA